MTKYQLSLHADRLPRRGFLGGRPNSYAVVTISGGKELGRTEVRDRTTSPDWCRCIFLELSDSSTRVPIWVSIYDQRRAIRDDKLIAEAIFEASEVVRSPGHMLMKDSFGTQIVADIQESIQGPAQGYISLHLRGLDIKNVERGLLGLGRSDPFFEISKKNSDHAAGVVRWNSVYRSEYIKDHLNPYWEPFNIGLEELCYCNLDWPLKISVFDFEESGKHRQIGEFEVTAQKLIERIAIKGNADRDQAFELILDEHAHLKGLVCVLKAELNLENVPLSDDLEAAHHQYGGAVASAPAMTDDDGQQQYGGMSAEEGPMAIQFSASIISC